MHICALKIRSIFREKYFLEYSYTIIFITHFDSIINYKNIHFLIQIIFIIISRFNTNYILKSDYT